jgi:hypothetical protein
MRRKIITVFVIPLIAALAVHAAAASERHHARTKDRVVASERLRNSNAYFAVRRERPAPPYWAAPGENPVSSYLSNLDEGMMAGGHPGR